MSNSFPEKLFLRLSSNALCMARYDAEQPTEFACSLYRLAPQMSLAANLREAGRTQELMQAPLKGMVQVLVNTPTTYVPLAEFQEEDSESIYSFCYPAEARRRVFYDIVPSVNAVVLFSLRESTCRALEEYFDGVNYISTLTPVMRRFSTKGLGAQGQKREFVYVNEKRAHVFVFEDNRMLVANSFEVQGAVDAVYYVLNVAQQIGLRLAPANDEGEAAAGSECDAFFVAGDAFESKALANELRKYAVSVRELNASAEFNRHVVTTNPDVPYDLITMLLK